MTSTPMKIVVYILQFVALDVQLNDIKDSCVLFPDKIWKYDSICCILPNLLKIFLTVTKGYFYSLLIFPNTKS